MADSSNSSNSSTGSVAGVGAGVGSVSTGSQVSSAGPSSTGSTGASSNTGSSPSIGAVGAGASGGVGSGKGLGAVGAAGAGNAGNNTTSTVGAVTAQPAMTVDEVYGKGNQSIVESQGDYEAISNEKSNVETQTFGKQDEISFTPKSITENKGEVENDAIGLFEGLDFQQKDKESQEVMEARKSRDEAEAEDKANQMRDSLKAKTDPEDSINPFQIGNDDIDNIYTEVSDRKVQDLQSKSDVLTQRTNEMKEADAKLSAAEAKQNELLGTYKDYQDKAAAADETLSGIEAATQKLADSNPISKAVTERSELFQTNKANIAKLAESYGIDIGDVSKMGVDDIAAISPKVRQGVSEYFSSKTEEVATELSYANKAKEEAELSYNNALKEQKRAKAEYDNALRAYDKFEASKESFRNNINSIKSAYENGEIDASKAVAMLQNMSLMADYQSLGLKTADMVYLAGGLDGKYLTANPSVLQSRYIGAEKTDTTSSNAETSIQAARETLESSALSPEQKAQAEQTLAGIETSREGLIEATKNLTNNLENANPADIEAYVAAQKQYEDNLKSALDGNPFTKTDFNKAFVEAVAKANDFTVTLADGTKTTYSQFATDMATKSPEVAKAMYEAKAQKYEDENHPVLARLERAKAAMVSSWLGSKLTQADNQVRGQFNQMAKTNMRATYAAYNNVLNNPNASPEAKAEASAAINQANGLMTASAALQASTGFLSGISDSMKDGVYGVTDPEALNAYQKTLNAIDNFAKITLGLGVTPGANKAYQNMYYMAGAKVQESGLFGRDFDSDGFALCQEYGNNAAAGMIAGAGELATGVALFFNPAMSGIGLNLVVNSIKTFINGLYGVQKEARKSQKYTSEVVSYFKEAKDIAEQSGNKEAVNLISEGITQIENFELKSDEVGNLDNWLEGSGSNTATNEKFNQSLSYDEWLKLIEADPTMQEYAKKLIAEKKNK